MPHASRVSQRAIQIVRGSISSRPGRRHALQHGPQGQRLEPGRSALAGFYGDPVNRPRRRGAHTKGQEPAFALCLTHPECVDATQTPHGLRHSLKLTLPVAQNRTGQDRKPKWGLLPCALRACSVADEELPAQPAQATVTIRQNRLSTCLSLSESRSASAFPHRVHFIGRSPRFALVGSFSRGPHPRDGWAGTGAPALARLRADAHLLPDAVLARCVASPNIVGGAEARYVGVVVVGVADPQVAMRAVERRQMLTVRAQDLGVHVPMRRLRYPPASSCCRFSSFLPVSPSQARQRRSLPADGCGGILSGRPPLQHGLPVRVVVSLPMLPLAPALFRITTIPIRLTFGRLTWHGRDSDAPASSICLAFRFAYPSHQSVSDPVSPSRARVLCLSQPHESIVSHWDAMSRGKCIPMPIICG